MAEENGAAGEQPQQQYALQRIYVKDVSFEAPQGFAAFKQQWQPEINFNLGVGNTRIDEQNIEVVLTLTVSAKQGDDTAFLVEVQQAGIFTLIGFDDAMMAQVLNIACPQTLYPYAREVVEQLVIKGSFPPNMLPLSVNFEAMFQQAQQQQQGAEQ